MLGFECGDLGLGQRLRAPLLLVLAEDLERLAAGLLAVAEGFVQPAGDRHVRAESHAVPSVVMDNLPHYTRSMSASRRRSEPTGADGCATIVPASLDRLEGSMPS